MLLGGLVLGHVLIVRLLGFADVHGSRGFHPFYPEHTRMGVVAGWTAPPDREHCDDLPAAARTPANPQEVASDVSPPWYFSAPFMWITLLPGPVALWSLLGFAGLFVIYPFLDRMLAERGWPMDVVNAMWRLQSSASWSFDVPRCRRCEQGGTDGRAGTEPMTITPCPRATASKTSPAT